VSPQPPRRPRLVLLRHLLPASPPLTSALAAVIAGSVAAAVGFVIAVGALLGGVGPAVRAGAGSAEAERLTQLALLTCALFAVRQLLAPAQTALAVALGRRVDEHIQRRAIAAALAPDTVEHLDSPELQDRLALVRGVGPAQHTAASALIGLAGTAGRMLLVAGYLIVVSWHFWWVGLALAMVLAALRPAEVRRTLRSVQAMAGRAAALRRSDYLRTLCTDAAAAKEVRIFGLVRWIGARTTEAWQAALADIWRERRRDERGGVLAVLVTTLAYTGAFAVVGRAGLDGDVGLGVVATVVQALLGSATYLVVGEDEGRAEFGSLGSTAVQALEAEPEVRSALVRTGASRPPDRRRCAPDLPRRAVVVDDVTFAYPGRSEPVFENLSMEIPAGRSLAVVGLNGAGKSTLIMLLAGLRRPQRGRILVDGVDLAELDLASWRRQLAVVFQDFARPALPAADNVALDLTGSTEERLDRAAAAAGATAVVDRLQQGWRTPLSKDYAGGTDLSGGEWQRIALARGFHAVHAGARMLILDEPTANVDIRGEAELFERLLQQSRGLTTVLVSHRFATVRRADQICVLGDGKVLEQGDHRALLDLDSRYAESFRLQASAFGLADQPTSTIGGGDRG